MADEADTWTADRLRGSFPGLRLIGGDPAWRSIRGSWSSRRSACFCSSSAGRCSTGCFRIRRPSRPSCRGQSRPRARESRVDLDRARHSPRFTHRLSEPVRLLTTPLFALLDPRSGWATMLHALLGVVWLIVVWGVCGGAIARIAVVQEAQMRQTGIGEAFRFALEVRAAADPGPALPFAGPGVLLPVVAAFGLLYRLPVVGPALAGALLIIPLAAGLGDDTAGRRPGRGLAAFPRRRGRRGRRRARRLEPDLQLPEPAARLVRGRVAIAWLAGSSG